MIPVARALVVDARPYPGRGGAPSDHGVRVLLGQGSARRWPVPRPTVRISAPFGLPGETGTAEASISSSA